MPTGTILMFPQELPDFLSSGVTHIVDGIVMLALKEIHLEGQYGEQLVDVALDVLDAILFPSPYLGGYIVVDRTYPLGFHILGNIKIEAWIVYQYHNVRLPGKNVLLTVLHVVQYRAQVQQHRHETHVSQFPIVFDARTTHFRHQVTTEEAELSLCIALFQHTHQVRGVQVTRGFSNYQIILHPLDPFPFLASKYITGSSPSCIAEPHRP